MSRTAFLTGTAGGITGTITTFIGIIWAVVYPLYHFGLEDYASNLFSFSYLFGLEAVFVSPYPYFLESLFILTTMLLTVLLIVTCILVGVGFYGTYKIGGGAMGAAALEMSIVGTVIATITIFLGSLLFRETHFEILHTYGGPYYSPSTFYSYSFFPVYAPGTLVIWLGFIILGVTFIVLGAASIVVREITPHPGAAMAGGILSIIGGALLITSFDGLMLFLGLVGFVLLFVTMILWSVVFFSSREV